MNARLFERALRKGAAAERLDREEALALAAARTPELIHRLGEAAMVNRIDRFGRNVTYVFNLQVNPSNLCVGDCGFCDFSAKPGDGAAYVMDEDEIFSKVEAMQSVELHIVGGLVVGLVARIVERDHAEVVKFDLPMEFGAQSGRPSRLHRHPVVVDPLELLRTSRQRNQVCHGHDEPLLWLCCLWSREVRDLDLELFHL